jgi:processive 1,2-diacylglycerol beta-glucosyltransferase
MRVLIPTVTAGAGHLQAALALEEAWRVLRPADEIRRVDVLDYTPKLYRKIYVKGYLKLIEHAPDLWAMFFKKTDNPARIKEFTKFRRRSSRMTAAKYVREMLAFKPDVVLCPHYLPLEIMGGVQTRRRVHKRIFPYTVCVVTDFEAHALWMEPCVNLFCVAAEETKARLVARGAHEAQVAVTGIPIAQKFSSRIDRNAVRTDLRLRSDIPTLLVLGGGFGMGPVGEILGELDKIESPLQLIVVCGRNEALKRKLSAISHRHETRVLGFATNMHELMSAADLILTKPGGLTTSEALAIGKPLFILNPIPGQEAANSDFLLEKGAAVKVNCIEDLPFKLTQLLGSKKLAHMTRAARQLGKPKAALTICEETLRRLDRADSFNGPAPRPRAVGARAALSP